MLHVFFYRPDQHKQDGIVTLLPVPRESHITDEIKRIIWSFSIGIKPHNSILDMQFL